MTLKVIPRLCHSLNLIKNNQISYDNEIAKDWICIKLQKKINIGIKENIFPSFLFFMF